MRAGTQAERTLSRYNNVVLPALSYDAVSLASRNRRPPDRRHPTRPRINILISFFVNSRLENHDIELPMMNKMYRFFRYYASVVSYASWFVWGSRSPRIVLAPAGQRRRGRKREIRGSWSRQVSVKVQVWFIVLSCLVATDPAYV